MSAESLIAFNLVLMAAIASPGAALMFFVKTTVASGRRAGIATGAGLGVAASLWTLAALLGLESLFRLFPWAYTTLKVAGAAYLLWIAVDTWRHASAPVGKAARASGRSFLAGLLVNAGNPKSVLFAAAVIVVVFPQGLNGVEIALIVANHLALEIAFYTVGAFALSSAPARQGYLNAKPVIDRISATILGALGLRLLFEKETP